jgi:hypothetical protein
VTGRDLYDQLGSSIVNNIGVSSNNSWTLNAFTDGEPATLAKADIIRSNTNLKDNTYNIILDKYGYLIGIEQNEDPDQYVFLIGLVVKNKTVTSPVPNGEKEKPFAITEEIYTLYKDNGYIIAAVTVEAEDDGVSKTYAYIRTDDVKRERYNKADDEWTWVREAIVGGKIVDLTEVGGGTDLSELEDMEQGKWYELKMDADDNVKDSTELTYKNGALYTSVEDKEGFSVFPRG